MVVVGDTRNNTGSVLGKEASQEMTSRLQCASEDKKPIAASVKRVAIHQSHFHQNHNPSISFFSFNGYYTHSFFFLLKDIPSPNVRYATAEKTPILVGEKASVAKHNKLMIIKGAFGVHSSNIYSFILC